MCLMISSPPLMQRLKVRGSRGLTYSILVYISQNKPIYFHSTAAGENCFLSGAGFNDPPRISCGYEQRRKCTVLGFSFCSQFLRAIWKSYCFLTCSLSALLLRVYTVFLCRSVGFSLFDTKRIFPSIGTKRNNCRYFSQARNSLNRPCRPETAA